MKNKILSILCFFILFSCIFFNNNVFATTYDLSDYENIDLKNGSWVIFRSLDTDNIYMLTISNINYPYIFCDGENPNSAGGNWLCCAEIPLNHRRLASCSVYLFNKNNCTFSFYKNGGISNDNYFNVGLVEFIASGIDIHSNQSGTVVFQATPVTSPEIIPPEEPPEVIPEEPPEVIQETTEILAVETVEQLPVAIAETMKVVIPVGLGILGIGLVIYLIKRVIYSVQ